MEMKFTLPYGTYNSSSLITRNILKQSKNLEISSLYETTAPKSIEPDTLLHLGKPKNPKSTLVNKTVNKILDDMKGRKEQCSCISINQWWKVCEEIPQNIFIFVCKEAIPQLANNTNLFRWKSSLK